MKRKKRLLVVDDDPSVRTMLKRVLAGEGYHVRSAASGATALQVAESAPPDLVLLEPKLPEENGWDVFGRLTRKWPSLPVVVITARPNQLFTALAAGVGALVEKPLPYSEVASDRQPPAPGIGRYPAGAGGGQGGAVPLPAGLAGSAGKLRRRNRLNPSPGASGQYHQLRLA